MKKTALLLTTFCLGLSTIAPAFAADWKKLGLEVLEEKKEGDKSSLRLKDSSGREFALTFIGEPAGKKLNEVVGLKNRILGWNFIKARSLRILISGDALDAHLVPATFACGKKDVLPFLPGGLILRQSGDALQYNFRLVVKNVFVRIKGVMSIASAKTSAGKKGPGDEICGKATEALANPAAYARKRDPEYILRKLDELEARLEKLKLENGRLRASRDRLRYALITLHNAGFFSGPTPPDPRVVERIVALKKAEPALKPDGILTKLRAEKLDASSKVVRLVFAVYFNEFEK